MIGIKGSKVKHLTWRSTVHGEVQAEDGRLLRLSIIYHFMRKRCLSACGGFFGLLNFYSIFLDKPNKRQ